MGQFLQAALNGPAPQPQQPKSQPQSQGFSLTDLLPTAGGILGDLGGGALGTLVAPGAGTAAGAVAGGAAGSGLGELIRELLKGQSLDAGSIGTQAALGGVGSGIGQGIGLGAKALGFGAKAVPAITDAAGNAAARGGADTADNLLTQLGNSARQKVLNPKVTPSPTMFGDQQALARSAEQFGFKGSASDQLQQINKTYNDLNKQIGTVLGKNTETVPLADAKTAITSALDGSARYDPADPQYAKAASRIMTLLGKNGDQLSAQSLQDFKNTLYKEVSNATFKKLDVGGSLSPKEEVSLTVLDAVNGLLDKVNPEVRPLTKQQSILHDLVPGLSKNVGKSVVNVPLLGGVGTGAQQKLTDLVGRSLQNAGRPATPALRGVSAALGQAAVPRGGQAAGQTTPAPTDQLDQPAINSPFPSSDQPASAGPKITSQQLAQLLLADLATTGGKNASTINSIGALLGASPAADKQAAADKKSQGLFKTAQSGIQKITDSINRTNYSGSRISPGYAAHALTLKGQELNGSSTDIATINSALPNIIEALKGLTGTGRITNTEINAIGKITPYDTRTEALAKINQYADLLNAAVANGQ